MPSCSGLPERAVALALRGGITMRRMLYCLATLVLTGAWHVSAQAPATHREVRITAQQVRESPPAFVFLVTNLANTPLNFIDIGGTIESSTTRGLLAADFNEPTRMLSPPGWTTMVTPSGGTNFFGYIWRTTDKAQAIQPGESRCGFRVELPVFYPPKIPLYSERVLAVQTTFQNLPFTVLWPDAVRSEGVITAHLLGRK